MGGKCDLFTWLVVLFSVVGTAPSAVVGDSPPNIIMILVDDQGWTGTSVQMDPNIPESRSDFYQTPNLESMAAAGMRFSNAYAAASICSPTRASILVGKSPAQLQMTEILITNKIARNHDGLPLTPAMPIPLSPTEVALPERVKQANPNYVTAHFGKWHLTKSGFPNPDDMGYDVFGSTSGSAMTDPKRIFSLTKLANDFMQDRVDDSDPFFLQLSHIAVHDDIEAFQETIEKYENLPPGTRHSNVEFAAMTEDLDTGIGMLMDKVQELGILDNTYIIYSSDNGGRRANGTNSPLSKGKGELFEGGIRVPFLVQGPEIEPGSVSDVPITSMDIFTTISELAGNTEPLPEGVEGASLVPILTGGGELPEGMENLQRQYGENGELFFHFPHNFGVGPWNRERPISGVRDGDFKLLKMYAEPDRPEQIYLFNLADSITESKLIDSPLNLAEAMPEKTAELLAKLDKWLEDVDASQAYDVSADIQLIWDAGQPGADQNVWRSTVDVDYRARETWTLEESSEKPQLLNSLSHQPGLPGESFHFDGDDGMTRKFFHVADRTPRRNTEDPGQANFDRSASFEFWVRFNSLDGELLLFESGDGTNGLSLTFGDGDNDGDFDELRFRALDIEEIIIEGEGEGESESEFVEKHLSITSEFDLFSNPLRDFVHVVAVFSDDVNDRYAEIYVNGALFGRVDGVNGPDDTIRWDGSDDEAGLGRLGGSQLGANGGTGDLPFSGGNLDGELAYFRFYNHVIDGDTVQTNYNATLEDVDIGIVATSGAVQSPIQRPTDVSEGGLEADDTIWVLQERNDTLESSLQVDILPVANQTYGVSGLSENIAGELAADTKLTSYLLHFDPVGDPESLQNALGTVTFHRPIQGILIEQASLENTDGQLGAIGRYTTDRRELDLNVETLMVSDDLRTLTVSLGSLLDEIVQLRVLTERFSNLMGDMDFNGHIDVDDILRFVLGIQAPAEYEAMFGLSPSVNGDFDDDGDLDFDDITGFAFALIPAQDSVTQSVPEPHTYILLMCGTIMLFMLRLGVPPSGGLGLIQSERPCGRDLDARKVVHARLR